MLKLLKKIKQFFVDATGNRDCNSVGELKAYCKPGSFAKLQFWVSQKIVYTPDTKPEHKWQDLDLVVRNKASDCEEKAAIEAEVINGWGYEHSAHIICMVHPNPDKNHAICFFNYPSGCGVMDDSRLRYFKPGTPLADIIREQWPGMASYVECSKYGYAIGKRIEL